jgi:hypothetical protein
LKTTNKSNNSSNNNNTWPQFLSLTHGLSVSLSFALTAIRGSEQASEGATSVQPASRPPNGKQKAYSNAKQNRHKTLKELQKLKATSKQSSNQKLN